MAEPQSYNIGNVAGFEYPASMPAIGLWVNTSLDVLGVSWVDILAAGVPVGSSGFSVALIDSLQRVTTSFGSLQTTYTLYVKYLVYGPEESAEGGTRRWCFAFGVYFGSNTFSGAPPYFPSVPDSVSSLEAWEVEQWVLDNLVKKLTWNGLPLNVSPYSSSGTWYDVSENAFGMTWAEITAAASAVPNTDKYYAHVDYQENFGRPRDTSYDVQYIVYGPEAIVSGATKRKVYAMGVSLAATATTHAGVISADVVSDDVSDWAESKFYTEPVDPPVDPPPDYEYDPGSIVGGALQGWTLYHDALVKEMTALMSRSGWQSDAAILARLDKIKVELQAAAETVQFSPLSQLLAEFQLAMDDTNDANEDRYYQLVKSVVNTGETDPNELMSYPEIARHMLTGYFSPLTTAFAADASVQKESDSAIADAVSQVNVYIQEVAFPEILFEHENDGSNVLAKHSDLSQTVNDQMFPEFEEYVLGLDQEIVDAFDEVNETAQEMLTALGRTPDPIGMKKVDLYLAVQTGKIAEMVRKSQDAKEIRIRRIESLHASQVAQIVETVRQADVKRELLTSRLAAYQEFEKLLFADMARATANQTESATRARIWDAEKSRRLAELYQVALGVVERRTDAGPTLADIANLTMNVGRGQAAQEMLGSFKASSYFAQPGSQSGSVVALMPPIGNSGSGNS